MRFLVMEIGSGRRVGYVDTILMPHTRSAEFPRLRMAYLAPATIPVCLDEHVSADSTRWIWVRPFDVWFVEAHGSFQRYVGPKRRVRKRRRLVPAVGAETHVFANR